MKNVKRPAQPGECIEIVPNNVFENRYKIGDKFVVSKRIYSGVLVGKPGEHMYISDIEYVVLERYNGIFADTPDKQTHPRRHITLAAITIMAMTLALFALSYLLTGAVILWLSGAPL